MNLLERIKQIEDDKINNKKAPSHVLFIPLSIECLKHGISKEKLSAELNKLYVDGKIKVGQTINDQYIKSI